MTRGSTLDLLLGYHNMSSVLGGMRSKGTSDFLKGS